MNPIIALEEQDLLTFLDVIRDNAHRINKLRVAFDEGSVKFKINEGMWSPAFGRIEK